MGRRFSVVVSAQLVMFVIAMMGAPGWARAGAGEAASSEPEALAVHVTGRAMVVNGQAVVPRGMFGVHWTDLDPARIEAWGVETARQMHGAPTDRPTIPGEREDWAGLNVVIDCLGDRYHPATVLTNRNYKQHFANLGGTFAQRAAGAQHQVVAEFWNETFLNWSYKPGVNYDPQFYETEGRRLGGPMTIKGWDKPLEHLVWGRAVRTVHADGRSNIMSYLAYNYIGRHHPAGHEFEFRGGQYRNQEMWWGKDPTQVSYWSGRQNAQFYNWMLVPFARAVKETNPKVEVVAGPAFHPSVGGWRAWEILYKPVIDEAWRWIDGVNEHHYYSDPRAVAVEYEVVCAYAMGRYGKFLRTYNTESGGRADPSLPGSADLPRGDALDRARQAFGYGLRDIAHMLHMQPDKAATRTTHGADKADWGLGGDEFVFRLFKPLRGRLMEAAAEDSAIWPLASLNDAGQLVVLVFNDHRSVRRVNLTVDAPRGTRIALVEKAFVAVDREEGRLALVREPVQDGVAHSPQAVIASDVPSRSAVRFVYDVEGQAAPREVHRRQFFAPDVLYRVNPDEFEFVDIEIDPEVLAKAERAYVRLGLSAHDSGATWRIDGKTSLERLPSTNGVVMIPVNVKDLSPTTRLAFQAGVEKADGLLIPAVSIVVETAE